MTMTKLLSLLPCALLVGCDSGPSREESVMIWSSATSALASAQGDAVTTIGSGQSTLDFSGPCDLGGSVSLSGSYTDSDDPVESADASFDLGATFSSCKTLHGSIDGELRWTATTNSTSVTTSMKGDLDWEGQNGSGSCHFDLETVLSESIYSFKGSLCGYDVASELSLDGQ
jgi:hypothetical protein